MSISRPVFFISFLALCLDMAVLTKYILFKQPGESFHRLKNIGRPAQQRPRENTVLFATIQGIYNSRQSLEYKFRNIGGNILGFVPLGVLLPLLFFRRRRFFKTLLSVACISLLFESIQRYTGLGVFDVDDLLLNTFGGVLGYVLFVLMAPVLHRRLQMNDLRTGVRIANTL